MKILQLYLYAEINMNTMKFLQHPFLMMIALVAVSTFVGCNDNPESPDGTEVTVPDEGSTYTYSEYKVDAAGTKDDTTEQSVVATVVDSDLTIGGKSNVVMISETFQNGKMDTAYVIYESNGDVSLFLRPGDEVGLDRIWVTIPFASHSAKSFTLNDTIVVSGIMTPASFTIGTKWIVDETVTINGAVMDAWVGQIDVSGTVGSTAPTNSTLEIYFVPEIGYFFRQNKIVSFSLNTTRTVRLLASYSLTN
jgi:hypothetical protein